MKHVVAILIASVLGPLVNAQELRLPKIPEPTENDARDIIEMHLGIRPEKVDMSNVERWNYGTHLTIGEGGFFTLVKLESEAYKSENNVCRKKQLRLEAPSWQISKEDLMRYPEWRQDVLYAAPAPDEKAPCSSIKHWTKIDPSIVIPDQIFDLFKKSQGWLTNVSVQDFCSATKLRQTEYCTHLHQRLKSGINAAELVFAKLYPVADGNDSDVSIELQFRLDDYEPLIILYIHAKSDDTLFKKVTIREVMH